MCLELSTGPEIPFESLCRIRNRSAVVNNDFRLPCIDSRSPGGCIMKMKGDQGSGAVPCIQIIERIESTSMVLPAIWRSKRELRNFFGLFGN